MAHSGPAEVPPGDHKQSVSLWAKEKVHAWELPTWDLVKRTPDERARVLEQLGVRHYAYLPMADSHGETPDWNTSQLDVDAEITAMQKHGIEIRAWYFWINVDDPGKDATVTKTLEAFQRHGIHPQIWVPQSFAQPFPEGREAFPQNPAEQRRRIERESDRIAKLVKLAAPYGCKVNLYNHRGWFGMVTNQLAMIEELKRRGLSDVGMVYNFPHSSTSYHNDAANFPEIWDSIKAHVVAVNLGFGFRELDMMRTIQESGWQGDIGVEPLPYGDAALTLKNALWLLDWSAAQLSGAPK